MKVYDAPKSVIKQNEQQFKMAFIKELKKKHPTHSYFCIESESTVAGFPDVMCLNEYNVAWFFEFKYSDKNGVVHFQKTQPAFYKRNKTMYIDIVAYNAKNQTVHVFPAKMLLEKGRYELQDNCTVSLGDGNESTDSKS